MDHGRLAPYAFERITPPGDAKSPDRGMPTAPKAAQRLLETLFRNKVSGIPKRLAWIAPTPVTVSGTTAN